MKFHATAIFPLLKETFPSIVKTHTRTPRRHAQTALALCKNRGLHLEEEVQVTTDDTLSVSLFFFAVSVAQMDSITPISLSEHPWTRSHSALAFIHVCFV